MMTISKLFILIIYGILSLIVGTNGQFESPNNLCGGWFKSEGWNINYLLNGTQETNNGTIGNLVNKTCMWTISPNRPYLGFDLTLSNYSDQIQFKDGNFVLQVTTFKDRNSKGFTHNKLSTGTKKFQVEGITMAIVLIIRNVRNDTLEGFKLDWFVVGDTDHNYRIMTSYHTWGVGSSNPYYASSTFGNEIATHSFPRGNSTNYAYKLIMNFDNIKFDGHNCGNGPITRNNTICDKSPYMLVMTVQNDASLMLERIYHNDTGSGGEDIESQDGIFLMWVGNASTVGGGRFQLIYETILN